MHHKLFCLLVENPKWCFFSTICSDNWKHPHDGKTNQSHKIQAVCVYMIFSFSISCHDLWERNAFVWEHFLHLSKKLFCLGQEDDFLDPIFFHLKQVFRGDLLLSLACILRHEVQCHTYNKHWLNSARNLLSLTLGVFQLCTLTGVYKIQLFLAKNNSHDKLHIHRTNILKTGQE